MHVLPRIKTGGKKCSLEYVYINIINPRMSTQESHAKSYKEKHTESILHFCFEQGMDDLLRLWRAPPFSEFSLTMGAGENGSFLLSKDVIYNRTNTFLNILYPPTLGTFPFKRLGHMCLRPII